MSLAQQVADTALRFRGTPFHHQGRVPGVGLDCVGLLVCSLRESGVEAEDRTDYHAAPSPRDCADLLSRIERHPQLEEVDRTDPGRPGDVLCFGRHHEARPMHLGIDCGVVFVHATQSDGVRVSRWNEAWSRMLARRFRVVEGVA